MFMQPPTRLPLVIRGLLLLGLTLLAGCSHANSPRRDPPTPTPLVFSRVADVLQRPSASAALPLSIAGCLYVDSHGARLLDGLSMSAGATPQPLAQPEAQIWIDPAALEQLGGRLLQAGQARYAVVLAHGQIEGPGTFGADKRYRYRLRDARLEPIAPLETTLSELLNRENAHSSRFVRLTGGLLAGERNVQLAERIGPGGLPASDASQIDLLEALRDRALIGRLQRAPGGQVAFGRVQVEGLWRDGSLFPLVITLLR